jgi:hypothetical protein
LITKIPTKDAEKRWVMPHFEGSRVAEFATESDLRRGRLAAEYILPHDYRGTNSVLFNGVKNRNSKNIN